MEIMDQTEGIDLLGIVERTWEELGFSIRATGYKVWVRTLPHPRKYKGVIWLPPNRQGFYGEIVHKQLVFAVVLSTGPDASAHNELPPGTVVAFQRVNFAWWAKLEGANADEYGSDDQLVGYLMNAADIVFIGEEAASVAVPDLRVAS